MCRPKRRGGPFPFQSALATWLRSATAAPPHSPKTNPWPTGQSTRAPRTYFTPCLVTAAMVVGGCGATRFAKLHPPLRRGTDDVVSGIRQNALGPKLLENFRGWPSTWRKAHVVPVAMEQKFHGMIAVIGILAASFKRA